MDTKDQETAIAYQNKDIVSKLFGDRMKGKPLSLFGLGTDLKVVDVKPTNLPIVQARELRMDNLFELEDGTYCVYGGYTSDMTHLPETYSDVNKELVSVMKSAK